MDKKQQLKLLPEPKKTAWGQWLGFIIVLAALIGLGYYITQQAPSPAASIEVPVAENQGDASAEATHAFEWTFRIVGGNPKTGADLSEVSLTVDGVTKVVSTYPGHCSVLGGEGASAWPLVEGELTAVVCSWAGAGDEVGVFLENGAYVVKHGAVTVTGEGAAGRGSYETLFTI